MYGNYQYSLTDDQQSAIQLFLRFLPKEVVEAVETMPFVGKGTFDLLHQLTYAESWTKEPSFNISAITPARTKNVKARP